MSTSKNNTTPMSASGRASELSRAFVDQKYSKRGAAKDNAIADVKDIDIRFWPVSFRSALPEGETVPIYVGGHIAVEISKPLLKITSTMFDKLFQDGVVKLPIDTEEGGVVHLVDYLKYVSTTTKKPAKMSNNISTFMSLSVCTAARLLGMDMYVDHVYKKCEAMLRVDPPTYEDLDAILAFNEQHDRLFKIAVNSLAVHVRNGSIPDPEVFQTYLAQYSALDKAIKVINDSFAEQQRKTAEYEELKTLQEEARANKQEAAQRIKSEWAVKNAKRAALEKACMHKSRGSLEKRNKFSAEERAHWISTRGEKIPKGC